ncbi:MAG: aspartate/glutamate racemase family protein [Rhodospirillales bacterium]|nr:aspartate/glutamate racemase family protein [Rhodospirillales bacterium]
MTRRILVINPNSSADVTAEIDRVMAPLRGPDIDILCTQLDDAPPGIQSQRDSEIVVPLVLAEIEIREDTTDAFVIACYSDPGLFAAREVTTRPVFGVAQSALAFAGTLGERVGVISLSRAAVARHMAYARALRMDGMIVADLPVGKSVAELQDEAAASGAMIDAGRDLVERFDANVIVLGCAGMARHRERMEKALGCPVVDPTEAAVGLALTSLRCRYRTVAR